MMMRFVCVYLCYGLRDKCKMREETLWCIYMGLSIDTDIGNKLKDIIS